MMGDWTNPNNPLARGSQPFGGLGVDGSGRDEGEVKEPVSVLGVEENLTMKTPVA